MERVDKSIEIECPLRTVYNQWTQFEEFPKFMKGVKRVTQLDDRRLFWEAEIAGKHKEWNARIVDQIPDQRIAWEGESGEPIAGVVTFEPSSARPESTRVNVQLTYDPDGFVESQGDAVGVVSRRVEKELENFKVFIQNRHQETGAWRGTIRE
jgi:uncharacterized membrane protein